MLISWAALWAGSGEAHPWPGAPKPTWHIDPRCEPEGAVFTPPAAKWMHLAWTDGAEPDSTAKLTEAAWRSQDVHTAEEGAHFGSCCPIVLMSVTAIPDLEVPP